MAERVAVTTKKSESEHKCSNSCKQKPGFNSSGSPTDRMLQLQRTAGNQAVQKLIKSRALQAKLRIGQPNDMYEQEADSIAEQVMKMPGPALQRKCDECDENKERLLQVKESPGQVKMPQNQDVPPIVHEVLQSSGQPLDPSTRAFMEPRFGHDFSQVRVHKDAKAAESASAVNAQAYTIGREMVFGAGLFAPESVEGRRLLAHELTHVVQQRAGVQALQRRAANCPNAPPMPPTITTMADFIALVQRVEADAKTKNDPIATARLIFRTKYEGREWEWLLPSTKEKAGVSQLPFQEGEEGGKSWRKGGMVTADDIGSLCFKLIVSLPGGGMEDPMHIIAAIVADAETLPAGTGATGLSRIVSPLPKSVSQRGVSTWVGDVGKAAAEWMAVVPLPKGGGTKSDYMLENAPPHDLMANVDGVAMTSKSVASGFALDKKKPLSDNLQQFFSPTKRTGRERRFHIFCNAEGFALEADGVTLTNNARKTIGQQVKDFADWFQKNDPHILSYVALASSSWQISKELVNRANDWQWFADEFIKFVQSNLTAEGP